MASPAVSRRKILRAKFAGVFRGIMHRPTSNQSSRGGAKMLGAVVHTTESSDSSFEDIIAYFRRSGTPASSHYVVDALPARGRRYVKVARMVPETRKAWTALSANPFVVQYELIGRARRTRAEWLGKYRAQLETLAVLVADDVLQYDLPIRRALPGVVGHVDLPRFGFKQSHWDPGPGFPWPEFLRMVHEAIQLASPRPLTRITPVPGARRGGGAHRAQLAA
jgi:N-acetyl-anhydromuramyl-L-alanine amidase AmpD